MNTCTEFSKLILIKINLIKNKILLNFTEEGGLLSPLNFFKGF